MRPAKRQKTNPKAQVNRDLKPDYLIVDGFRYVKPYVYEYLTFVKARWVGRSILDVYTSEFSAYPKDYFLLALESGRLLRNGEKVPPETLLRDGDFVLHKTHRHEPPVASTDVQIIQEDENLIVVCKPSSIPIHSSGAYHFNTLHYVIQEKRPDIGKLFVIHRLDRFTSGVTILAKNSETARKYATFIENRSASKTYLARVKGIFPKDENAAIRRTIEDTANQNCPAAKVEWNENNLTISCPIRCSSPKDGVWECHEEGKKSETTISFKSTNGRTSVLHCMPKTGRTHQIRLHLQLIGFPIANDPCYGGKLNYGTNIQMDKVEIARKSPDDVDLSRNLFSECQRENESENDFLMRTCKWCKVGTEKAFKENQLHCMGIWLHALRYKLGDDIFEASEPDWANSSFSL